MYGKNPVIMKVYYNKFYTSHPFVGKGDIDFDTIYCGDEGLLGILMLYGGIPEPKVTPVERQTFYHNRMKKCSINGSLFEKSFELDSYATSCKILQWRDALVEAGWKLRKGISRKLDFINLVEPEDLPMGRSDCWGKIIQLSNQRSLLPEGSEIEVTQLKESIDPKIAFIFDNQSRFGIKISYSETSTEFDNSDMGLLKAWMQSGCKGEINFKNDGTVEFLRFDTDENALKYIATQPPQRWELYLCQQTKEFDNTLRYLGQPVCGSQIDNCEPQVVNLFMLGNGLFEYPLKIDRILAWLNVPLNPLGRKLAFLLAKSLSQSGGIQNKEWEDVIADYLKSIKDDKKKKDIEKNIRIFLPSHNSSKIKVTEVIKFNRELRKWVNGQLALENFPYEEIVREQLRQIDNYCNALIELLSQHPNDSISFLELQNWCTSLLQPKSYTQYEAEAGCRSLISRVGNIHSYVESLVWFCMNDEGTDSYPFEFLTEHEEKELKKDNVFLYNRKKNNDFSRYAIRHTILRSGKITLVESERISGTLMTRHPLMIQLNESVKGGLSSMMRYPSISSKMTEVADNVDNRSDETYVWVDNNVTIPLRIDKRGVESYSSIEQLIQYPFNYVCTYIAGLKDIKAPSLEDLNRTMGNVAHKVIELLFAPGSKGLTEIEEDTYLAAFDKAVQNVGLILLQPENVVQYNDLRTNMKSAIERLSEFISTNTLTVDASEFEFNEVKLVAGLVNLSSRCDMILTDSEGNKVVLDFKWKYNPKSYERSVKDGTDLQLVIYKYLVNKQFEKNVRSAYVTFPACKVISSDRFEGIEQLEPENDFTINDIIEKLINGIKFRKAEFDLHKIEHAEGESPEKSDYWNKTEAENLFPLKVYNDKLSEPYNKEYLKLM